MRPVIAFTLKHKVLVNLAFLVLMILGVISILTIPVDRMPYVRMGKVHISAFLPGASPSDVESLVTKEIEEALESLEQVEYIRSRSYRERSSILVKFVDDSDYQKLYDELRFKVLSIQNDLPEDMDPPKFTEIAIDEWLPALNVILVGDRSNRALSLIAEELKNEFVRIPGVKEVRLNGEYSREYHVDLSPEKMNRYMITLEEVRKALLDANVSIPAGDFDTGKSEYIVVVDERFRTQKDIEHVILRRDNEGSFVRVGDIMTKAEYSYRDPHVITSVNGKDCLTVAIMKQSTGNAIAICDAVEEIVEKHKERLAVNKVQPVITQDQRIYIDESMNVMGSNLLVGITLVMIIIWVVMGLRNALITTVGIPFSFLVTMIFMKVSGNSLNEITLFAFVLVAGIIVDDAIVVIENIYRRIQIGEPLKEAVVDGAAEVAVPVISATSTTVAAFLPMLIMSGSTGEFFAQIPIAVSFAIAASLIECLLILPSHFYDWPGAKQFAHGYTPPPDQAFMVKFKDWAVFILRIFMRNRAKSLGVVLVAFLGALFILGVSISGTLPLLRIKFFPDNYNIFYVNVEAPAGTSLQEVSRKLKEMTVAIDSKGKNVVRAATAFAGFYVNEDYEQVYGSNYGTINVELPEINSRIFADYPTNDPIAHLDTMRKELTAYAKKRWGERWVVRVRAESDGPPTGKDLTIRIMGVDTAKVESLSRDIWNYLKTSKEFSEYLVDLRPDTGYANRIVRFVPDEMRVSQYELTPRHVARMAGSILDGSLVGEFRADDEDIDLRMRVDERFLQAPEDALNIPVIEEGMGPIRLGDIVKIQTYTEPGQFNRFQGERAITLSANLRSDSPYSPPYIVKKVVKYYSTIRAKYPGATLNFAGEYESTQKSYSSLMFAFLIALLIIYMILATQFNSYVQPFIILSAVVFALIGVVYGVFFTRTLFTINSFIATIGVTGVVVNDSLVLIAFLNNLHKKGMHRDEAVYEGVRIRLRPILLTTLTTTLGLLPMAIGIPYYSINWGTMAATFVTGLCTATLLTLFIVPVLWHIFMGLQERMARP
ncbi:efflux RND transporter permease subunit [Halodesulfovibrio marinisediminis]|uniref:Hydrophobic/amphiphilic exporter-1, HAE1 family n=1 Tax=Halodesulfovibrio marinisediminis DSM 17456 TaxID=1121457 RepID=A0A1N6DKB5_9BACT|nr:efflux RND transporter permease subunit [Halodesulfovibrio marinisediminis]SIN71157.1 hydrophobic/amphiphilic exporter-1, HAE1 family [Halodesulfovibrio marinisediminis DSM 17456]